MEHIDAKRLSLSCFLRVSERDGLVALVHQLRPEPVYLSKKNWRDIKACIAKGIRPQHKSLSELMGRGLLIDDSKVDQRLLEKSRKQGLKRLNRPTILYLMMAQGCNFACSYCLIPALAKQYGERLLSFEDAVAGVALWRRHIEEYPHDDEPYFLIFYGGEPLLNQGVLERLLPYLSEEQNAGRLPKKLELMLCTNGSLIDKRLSKLFARHEVTVAVGVDGPQEENDRVRIASDGSPTFAVIERAIGQLVSDGLRIAASVTITPMNAHRLAEYPDFLRKLGITRFGFNLMKGGSLIRELAGGSVEDYCRAAARGVLHGLANMAEDGQCEEYQLHKKLAALQNGLPFSVDCTCYGNQLVIQPDGQVSNCPFLRLDQGHVTQLPDTFRIGHTDTVKAWRRRLLLLDDSIITDGKNRVLNSGGCAWSSSELHGDIAAPDTVNAIFTEEVTNELIWTFLPKEQADKLRRGEATHWCYRRIGSLHTARADSL